MREKRREFWQRGTWTWSWSSSWSTSKYCCCVAQLAHFFPCPSRDLENELEPTLALAFSREKESDEREEKRILATWYLDVVVVDDESTIVASGVSTPVPVELSAAPADWETYEGQLLTLTDVTATSEPAYGQVSTNYAGLFIDDLFVRFDVANGESFGSVTGVLYYSYSEWKLEPRSEADLVP